MFALLRDAYLVATAPVPDIKNDVKRLALCIRTAAKYLAAGDAKRLAFLAHVRRVAETAKSVTGAMQSTLLEQFQRKADEETLRRAQVKAVPPAPTGGRGAN